MRHVMMMSLLCLVVHARIRAVVLGLRRAAGREVARNVGVANALLQAESQVQSTSVVAVRVDHAPRRPTTTTTSSDVLSDRVSRGSLLWTAAFHCRNFTLLRSTFYLPFG